MTLYSTGAPSPSTHRIRMKQTLLTLVGLVVSLPSLQPNNLCAQQAAGSAAPQKEIAITIDDLPLNGRRLELSRLQVMTGKLLAGINRHEIPAVGFVNESLLYVTGETDAR